MPFSNIINLQVRTFFFNAATDYLPYYKNFEIAIAKESTLLDVLNKIKAKNTDFSFPNKNVILKVNNRVTTADTSIGTVVELLGDKLKIEPASTYHSTNGLILNDNDFMKSFELLAPYASEEDKTYYESLYAVHYASETTNYNRQFIGDAILLLAHKMIADGNEHKKEILEAISDEFDGIRCCEYENNILHGEDHTQKIADLKKMLTLKDTASYFDKLTCGKKEHSVDHETLSTSNVALYRGLNRNNFSAIQSLIEENAASYVEFERSTKLAGQTLMDTHFEMAHKKAGLMMLDALDSGADILVCNEKDTEIFQKSIKACEKVVGRDIELKIISQNRLKALCSVEA